MGQRPFVVNVAVLRRHAGERRHESRRGAIAGLTMTGSAVPPGSEVNVDVLLESVHGGILANATVRAPWEGECRRCLAPARGEVEARVRELFAPDSDPDETYPLGGDQLDLEPLARDAVLLELPLAPLCREGCAGLCPTCGANRNEGTCSCAVVADPRWGPLHVLGGDGGDR
jgi:uncharacterized protein